MDDEFGAVERALDSFIGQVEKGAEPNIDELLLELNEDEELEFLELVQSYLSLKRLPRSSNPMYLGELGSSIGSYQLVSELGRGGSSTVYAAVNAQGQSVALKVLPLELASNPTSLRRFEREYNALQQLDHPNIVQVLDFGVAEGRPYLCMERMEEQTLADRIESQSMSTPDWSSERLNQAVQIMVQVTTAAKELHEKGIVHRDIKPSNILFDPKGNAKLGDFGLAHQQSATMLTTEGKALGTLAYMAPERLMSNAPDASKSPTVDVYSLGVCLFQSLTKELPFHGRYPEILPLIQQGAPPLSRFCPAPIDVRLQAIIEKCLEPNPRNRYQNAAALLADLDSFCRDSTVEARKNLLWRRSRRNIRSHPKAAFAVSAFLLVIIFLQGRSIHASIQRSKQIKQLLASADNHLANGKVLLANLPDLLHSDSDPIDPSKDVAAWQRLEKARAAFDLHFQSAQSDLVQALALAPDSADANAKQLALGRLRSEWHQSQGDFDAALVAWKGTTDVHADAILAFATLQVDGIPTGSTLEVERFDHESGIQPWPLFSAWKHDLIAQPALEIELRPGSYRLQIRRDGSEVPSFYPFVLYPEKTTAVSLDALPPKNQLDANWCFIPAGDFWYGGDPTDHASRAKSSVYLPSYFISKDELTFHDYDKFLRHILENGCPGEDHSILGRKPTDHFPPQRVAQYFSNIDAGNAAILKSGLMKMLDLPEDRNETYAYRSFSAVHDINLRDAQHYVVWRNKMAELENSPWRYSLPSERQWEKAARGADNRTYPWGNQFDWSIPTSLKNPNITQSVAAMANAMGIGRSPGDVSPYGCRDMAGNVREFTTGEVHNFNPMFVVCGGEESFYLEAFFRSDSRTLTMQNATNWDFGIRLVRNLEH